SILLGLVLLSIIAGRAVHLHLRAASMLLRFADPDAHGRLARLGTHAVDVSSTEFPRGEDLVPARLYTPRDVVDPPAVVLLHGVQRISSDEPRLVRFARAIAESGVVVLTPAIAEIAEYRIAPASIDTIGSAAHHLSAQRRRKVAVIGMSFAGGLALLAAAD